MKQVIALSALLTLALVGSYSTYFGEAAKDLRSGEVPIYNLSGLSQVAWRSENIDVVLDQKKDDHGEFVWVTVTERREVMKPKPPPEIPPDTPAEDDAPPEPEVDADPPEIVTNSVAFKGNSTAEDLWDDLNPLIAMRPLTLPDGVDDPFGFDDAHGTIDLTTSAGVVSLTIGGETYGAKDRYLQHEDQAFLVDDQTLRPLEYGKTRLLERILQPLSEHEVDTVTLVTPSTTLSFVQQNASDRAKAFWSLNTDPETEHPIAGAWFGKVFKMRAKQYVEDESTLGELTPVFRFETTGDGKIWVIDVVESVEKPGVYYAKCDFLRATVELTKSLAADAVIDLKQLIE
ncbi:MAG: hypothetical protein GWP91_01010 [Rhodobacterales bacterium]|nr:hypothetical protein [Rhodobacterales bacterium]